MESFGLFNFLKSAFSPPSDAPASEGSAPRSSAADAFSLLQGLFSRDRNNSTEAEPASAASASSEPVNEEPPVALKNPPRMPSPAEVTQKTAQETGNPFLELMARHDRISKNIERKAPKK